MSPPTRQPSLSMPAPKKKTQASETEESMQLTVRVPVKWWDDLEALAKKQSVPGLKVTRTDIARRAIALGIDALQKHPR